MTVLGAFLLSCRAALMVSAVLQPPQNIQLSSANFRHILTWDDPNNDSSVYYSVAYKHNFQALLNAGACTNITTRRCDLTKDLTDIQGTYNMLVTISTNQSVSEGNSNSNFSPILQTVIGPPIVDVVPCGLCIKVSIQPPVSYLWSEEKQQNISMLSDYVYPLMSYTIHLVNSGGNSSIDGYLDVDKEKVIPNLQPQTNYCVSVSVETSSNLRPTIPSALKCVITESTSDRMTLVIIVCVVGAVVFLVVILLVLFSLDRAGYIFMGRSFVPKVLKSFSASESAFSGSRECSQPICIEPVGIVDKKKDPEEGRDKEKTCGEGYASRKRLLSSDTENTGDTMSSAPLPSGTSSSGESSVGVSGSSAEREMTQELTAGPDLIVLPESSCPSSTHSASDKTSNLMFNNSGDFNVNLNSVSIADPEEVWTGFRLDGSQKEEPKVLNSAQRSGITPDADHCRPLPQEICMVEWGTSPSPYDGCSEEEEEEIEEEETSDNNELRDHAASGYMQR